MTILSIGPIALLALAACASFAQSPAAPEFEAAILKPAASGPRPPFGRQPDPPSQITRNTSARLLIMDAYGLQPWQVVGPEWIVTQRYELAAKLPSGSTQDQVPLMLRKLLADQLGLVVHREMREMPVYELLVTDGSKLQEVSGAAAIEPPGTGFSTMSLSKDRSGWPIIPPDVRGIGLARASTQQRYIYRAQPISELITYLRHVFSRSILDKTGLAGRYNFDLTYESPLAMTRAQVESNPGEANEDFEQSLLNGLKKTGLKLVAAKGPVEVLVVDRVNRVPAQ